MGTESKDPEGRYRTPSSPAPMISWDLTTKFQHFQHRLSVSQWWARMISQWFTVRLLT